MTIEAYWDGFNIIREASEKEKKIQNVNFFQKGGGDPKVYISKKFIHSEKRLQNGFP